LHWLKKKRVLKKPTPSESGSKTSNDGYLNPRPRQRRGKGARVTKASKAVTAVSLTQNGDYYRIPFVEEKNPRSREGLYFRNSVRWVEGESSNEEMHLPYIDRLGRYTGLTQARWHCDHRTHIATVTATVFRRLKSYALRHNKMHIVERNQDRLVRASFLYAATSNNYLWDRVLHFSRDLLERGTLIHKTVLKFLCKADDYIRFVYSHVCSQTKWLSFRAERPRDKSVKTNPTREPDKVWFKSGRSRYIKVHCLGSIARAMQPLAVAYRVIQT